MRDVQQDVRWNESPADSHGLPRPGEEQSSQVRFRGLHPRIREEDGSSAPPEKCGSPCPTDENGSYDFQIADTSQVHYKEKEHQCSLCGNTFARKDTLTR